jgi:tRNA(Ile2)-agmatinylcytidine synthase
MHIGLDDTDSTRKGCTTYVAALLVEKLTKLGADFIDYPNLIRLNPNVPWKTRGNGALCLRIRYDEDTENEIKETVVSTVEKNADFEFRGTDPGVVFLERARVPRQIRVFAKRAVTEVVTIKEALNLLAKFKGEAAGFKNGRGIVGGLAAIGETLQGDFTYEVLAYRLPENLGLKRRVDESSIFKMDADTAPYTFNNVDTTRHRVIITPRGPDPILFGIRGETSEIVKKAYDMTNPLEPVERWVIFRSNQGTDAHLKRIKDLGQLRLYSSIIARGVVAANPRMIRGRHVVFPIRNKDVQVDCAAYEPTGGLNRVARRLMEGDRVEVCGSVRSLREGHLTVNLEKIRLLKLASWITYQNPICPKCGKRLKSMGRNKGFRCEKCGFRNAGAKKVKIMMKRELEQGLYITSTRSQRHLTKPFVRYGLEKGHGASRLPVEGWHSP